MTERQKEVILDAISARINEWRRWEASYQASPETAKEKISELKAVHKLLEAL